MERVLPNAKDRIQAIPALVLASDRGKTEPARSPQRQAILRVGVFVAQPFDEHLFFWFVVRHQKMADAAAADKVADLFREILGMVAGAFEGLGHKDYLQAGMTGDVLGIFYVTEKDEVAEAIHFGVRAEHVNRFLDIALGKRLAYVGEHFFQHGGHLREFAGVLRIDTAPGRLGAGGETQEQVADTLEPDHELHAGEQKSGFGFGDAGDGRGHTRVDLHVDGVKILFALADVVEAGHGTGRNAFGSDGGGGAREFAGFNGALGKVERSGIGRSRFDAGRTHIRFADLNSPERARHYLGGTHRPILIIYCGRPEQH